MILPDEYVAQLGESPFSRAWCWLFHRRFWEYLTWGGDGFHHMNHCTKCENDWPEYVRPKR